MSAPVIVIGQVFTSARDNKQT